MSSQHMARSLQAVEMSSSSRDRVPDSRQSQGLVTLVKHVNNTYHHYAPSERIRTLKYNKTGINPVKTHPLVLLDLEPHSCQTS